ncbi:hypothetical protein [uncultured Lamprocystis sp.]|uniref:hypothetical protein n=1 Tax=uncultured Lamprocystis sp. TaxID=543132 RepID=UPI0025D36BDE|nr:hypothetical protein [uncultured Lamprocystis sp.]
MNSLVRVLTITIMLAPGVAAATGAADGAGAASDPPAAPDNRSGVTLYGAYLMHYRLQESDAAAGHFSPALPLDERLLTGAMQSLARAAYNQQPIDAANGPTLKPVLGTVIKLQDPEYEYRFVLDGSPARGVNTILVQRNALPPPPPPPEADAELLKELEKL